jgi:hypothetical protein
MTKSAEGVVEKAATFTGVVREFISILLLDEADKSIAKAKFQVKFQNGITIDVESDAQGVLKVERKGSGEFTIQLLEK